MASSYPLLGGAEGDGTGLQGEHSWTFKLMKSLLVPYHLNMHVTILGSIIYSFGSSRSRFAVVTCIIFFVSKGCLCGTNGYA